MDEARKFFFQNNFQKFFLLYKFLSDFLRRCSKRCKCGRRRCGRCRCICMPAPWSYRSTAAAETFASPLNCPNFSGTAWRSWACKRSSFGEESRVSPLKIAPKNWTKFFGEIFFFFFLFFKRKIPIKISRSPVKKIPFEFHAVHVNFQRKTANKASFYR